MAKVNGVGTVGCVEKIKFLQHRLFSRSGRLKGINLGTCGKQGDLAGTSELVDLPDLGGYLAGGASGEFRVHAETEIAVFEFGFETGPHRGEGEVGHSTCRISDIGAEGSLRFI